MDWRTTLIAISGAAIPPLLLGWFAVPSGPATTGPTLDPPPDPPAGKGQAVVQTLLLGAALAGVRIHLELSFAARHGSLLLGDSAEYGRAHSGLIDFPFAAGLAVGFITGAVLPGGHRKAILAWMIAAPGPVMAAIPLLPSDIAILAGAVLGAAGLGLGLSGQLVSLLRLATTNRTFRASALFQGVQNLGYGVGIAVPLVVVLVLGDTVAPDTRAHLLLGCSLILLAAGFFLALRNPKQRVAPQRGKHSRTSHPGRRKHRRIDKTDRRRP